MPIFKSTYLTEIRSQKKVELSTHTDRMLQHRFEKIMTQKKYPAQEEEESFIAAPTTHFLATQNSMPKHQSEVLQIQNNATTLDAKLPIISPPSFAVYINEMDFLRLRLTQGPLAGIILNATIQQGSLKLRLEISEQKRLKKVSAQQETLCALFGSNLDMPMTLEVAHEEN